MKNRNIINRKPISSNKGKSKLLRLFPLFAASSFMLGVSISLSSCQNFGSGKSSGASVDENGLITIESAMNISSDGSLTIDKIGDHYVGYIGEGAYKGSTSLESVSFSNSVLSLGKESFASCPSLSSMFIPSSVQYIAPDAFKGSPNLSITTDLSYGEWKKVYAGSDVSDKSVRCKRYSVYLDDAFYCDIDYGERYSVSGKYVFGYSVSDWTVIEKYSSSSKSFPGSTLFFVFTYCSDINVIPTYSGNMHSISFMSEKGTKTGSKAVKYGSAIGKVNVPTKTGYSFLGYYWNDLVNDEERMIFDAKGYPLSPFLFDHDITVVEKWEANTYKISLNYNNGSSSSSKTVNLTYDDEYSLPIPTKTGYEFSYWAYEGKKVESEGSWKIAEDATLEAVYSAINATVRLDYNGGSPTDSSSSSSLNLVYDKKYSLPEMKKKGYDFSYWMGDDGYRYASNGYWAGLGVNKLTANYTARRYTVNLMNDENLYSRKTLTYDASYSLPAISKTGYTFAGWYLDQGFSDENLVPASGTWGIDVDNDDLTIALYAKLTPNEYTITFQNVTEAEMPDGRTSMSVTYEQEYSLPSPNRVGYVFKYWRKSNDGTQFYPSATYTLASNLSLYPYFVTKKYKVVLHNGDATSEVYVNKYGDSYSLSEPTSDGYTFGGYYSKEDYSSDSLVASSGIWNTDSTLIDGDYYLVNLYAKMIPDVSTIYLHDIAKGLIGGNDVITLHYGDSYSIPSVSSNEYFTFAGWYLDENYSDEFTSLSGTYDILGDLHLYAKIMTSETHTLTLKANGGTFADGSSTYTLSVTYGKPIEVPEISYAHHKFLSWTKEGSEEAVDIASSSAFTMDTTLEANWEENHVSLVSFSSSYGEAPSSIEIEYGDSYILPSIDNGDDYEFLGWKLNEEFIDMSGTWDIDGDVTLVAAFRTVSYSNPSSSSYCFKLNASSGYYVSNNKGVGSSYAYCKISIDSPKAFNLKIQYISYGESNYDYGIFSNLDSSLAYSSAADSTGVKKSCKGESSSSAKTLDYGTVEAGTHFLTIKYIKDGSENSGNDTLQFKLIIA